MSKKNFSVETTLRPSRPRSKRLRESGLAVIVGSGGNSGGNSGSGGGIEAHSHANKRALDTLSIDEQDYLYISQLHAGESIPMPSKSKSGYADEAAHAAIADEAEHAKHADEAKHAEQSDNADRWDGHLFEEYLDQPVRTADDVTFGKVSLKGFQTPDFAPGFAGVGGAMDRNGNAELESLRIRRFLEVPELRYNRVDVTMGDKWCAPSAGIIETVDTTLRIVELKLEDGEIGSVKAGDICMGIFHSLNSGQNADVDFDDSRGNRRFAGFATTYFRVVEVLNAQCSKFSYQLRPVSVAYPAQFDPCSAMTFIGYGSFVEEDRQASRYETRTYQRYLKGINDWEFSAGNIAAQFGDLSNLSVHGLDMTGYSAYLNNIYMSGVIRQFTPGGDEIPTINDRGLWSAGMTCNRNDDVYWNNAKWRCLVDGTTSEPSVDSEAWVLLSEAIEGKGILSIDEYYLSCAHGSGITTATPGWTTTVQEITEAARYLWNYEIITYTDYSSTTTDPVVIGVYGVAGNPGRGIVSVTNKYAVSSSNETPPTSWGDSVPTMTATNKYLWNYEIITYTDNATDTTDKRVIGVYGDNGLDAVSILLSNETHAAPSNADGSSPDLSGAYTDVAVYRGVQRLTHSTDYTLTKLDGGCQSVVTDVGGNARVTLASMTEDGAVVEITVTVDSITYAKLFTVTKVKKGQDGGEGIPGCIHRISEWVLGVEYRNDELETMERRYLDIAVRTINNTQYRFLCRKTHIATHANAPTSSTTTSEHWQQLNDTAPIYTPFIMAKNASITFLQGNSIRIIDDDSVVYATLEAGATPLMIGGPSSDTAPFHVAKTGEMTSTKANITGTITATSGYIGKFQILGSYLTAESRYPDTDDFKIFRRVRLTEAGLVTRKNSRNEDGSTRLMLGIYTPQTAAEGNIPNSSGNYYVAAIYTSESSGNASAPDNIGLRIDAVGHPTRNKNIALDIYNGCIRGFRLHTTYISPSTASPITLSNLHNYVIVNTSSGNKTINLPATPQEGQHITLHKINFHNALYANGNGKSIYWQNGSDPQSQVYFVGVRSALFVYSSELGAWVASLSYSEI